MSKRIRENSSISQKEKKIKIDEVSIIKKIIIRNDSDPHIYVNIEYDYIKIGNYIYKRKFHNNDNKNTKIDKYVSLSLSQYNDVLKYVCDGKITLSFFNEKINNIAKIIINLKTDSSFEINTSKNNICKYIIDMFDNHVVTTGQKFNIIYSDVLMNILIHDIQYLYFGRITKDTEIEFKNFDKNIIIYNQYINIDSSCVKINITKCTEINNIIGKTNNKFSMFIDDFKFPLIIEKKILNKYIKRTLKDYFLDNDTLHYTHNNFEFIFNTNIMRINKELKYKNIYKLLINDNNFFNISSTTKNIIVAEDSKNAEKICLIVLPTSNNKYNIDDYILTVETLITCFKNKTKIITIDQILTYQIENIEVEFKINYIQPQSNNKIAYKILPDTKITFQTNKKSKFILVENSITSDIETIIFKIKPIKKNIFDIFSKNTKSINIDSKKLEKNIKNLFPKKTAIGHTMEISFDDMNFLIKVKDIIFKNIITEKLKYAKYGQILDTTTYKFETSSNKKKIIINNTSKTLPENPIQELEKYIGGISKELNKVIQIICLAKGKLKEEFNNRGLKATKGIIFYGPPGTGKTTLARNLGKLLGCEGQNFNLISGPEIFNKWVGESEANVRALFKPAKEAWKKFGKDSPIYMIVIDEIDALLPNRTADNGNPVRDSVVNQFLAEMDGLVEFYNIICIGITNRLELLDSAVIRSGRFGIHIKIDLPDKIGRKKIFDIHTKKLKELDRLEKINFDKLSDLTDKFSGADIENIVGMASLYSLERLNSFNIVNEKIIETHGKITEKDFIKAIKEISSTHKKNDQTVHNMYM